MFNWMEPDPMKAVTYLETQVKSRGENDVDDVARGFEDAGFLVEDVLGSSIRTIYHGTSQQAVLELNRVAEQLGSIKLDTVYTTITPERG